MYQIEWTCIEGLCLADADPPDLAKGIPCGLQPSAPAPPVSGLQWSSVDICINFEEASTSSTVANGGSHSQIEWRRELADNEDPVETWGCADFRNASEGEECSFLKFFLRLPACGHVRSAAAGFFQAWAFTGAAENMQFSLLVGPWLEHLAKVPDVETLRQLPSQCLLRISWGVPGLISSSECIWNDISIYIHM